MAHDDAQAPDPAIMTLDELRDALAPLLGGHAAFDGWGPKALEMAAAEIGADPAHARLAYPGGPVQMIDAWFGSVDVAMAQAFPADRLAGMKIRAKIGGLILQRLDTLRPHREALRRALAILAMPQNAMAAGRLAWRSADRIWRLAGDTSTDLSHYSKRTILIGVYGSTTLVFLDDETEDMAETRAFLDRRIGDVMKIETVKAKLRGRGPHRPSLSRFLGRLRYPA